MTAADPTHGAPELFDAIIVGGGPRAISTIERLTAHLAAQALPSARPLRIAIIDATEVGAGNTWYTGQPAAYLNNTYAADTTIYPDHTTKISGAPRPGPNLVEWAHATRDAGGHPIDWVRAEIAELQPWSFPSRRLQGVYYREQLAAVADPEFVEITPILGRATDLQVVPQHGGPSQHDDAAPAPAATVAPSPADPALGASTGPRHVVVTLEAGRSLQAPLAILAQGMVQSVIDERSATQADFATRHGGFFLAPGLASERDWHDLPSGESVIVEGLGANFFDVVGVLASNWGGRFIADPHSHVGRLIYLPSGREPHIIATSGRGVPYRAKADYASGFPPAYEPLFATAQFFTELRSRPEESVDFAAEVWPTIAKEFAWAYLHTLARRQPSAVATSPAKLAGLLAQAATISELEAILNAQIVNPDWAFQLRHLHEPTGGEPVSATQWRRHVARYIEHELGSMADPLNHPRQAVNRAMATIRTYAYPLAVPAPGADHAVLTGASIMNDVHGWFGSDSVFLASGPPPDRTRQLLALIEAGVVDLLGPQGRVELDEGTGEFVAHSPITGRTARARHLAQARMSKGGVKHTDDPLLRSLLAGGQGRLHRVGRRQTPSSAIETTTDTLQLVDARGQIIPEVIVLGIPASVAQPGSGIGASPGRPSPLLAGGDIAARHIIATHESRQSAPESHQSAHESHQPALPAGARGHRVKVGA